MALEPGARRKIAKAVAPLAASGGRARWVREENLHLTMAFLGQLPADVLPAIDARLAPLALVTRTEHLVLAGVGGFPRARPRVLWLGLEEGRPWFAGVAQAVRTALTEGLGLELDQRGPSAHVSLARLERPERALLAELEAAFAGLRIRSRADRLTLFSSVIGRGGPTYTVEREWAFRNGAGRAGATRGDGRS